MTPQEAVPILIKTRLITAHSVVVPVETCRQILAVLSSSTYTTRDLASTYVADLIKANAQSLAAFRARDKALLLQCQKLIDVFQRYSYLVGRSAVLRFSGEWPDVKKLAKLCDHLTLVLKGAAQAHLSFGEDEAKRKAEEARWQASRAANTPEQRRQFVRQMLDKFHAGNGGRAA